MLALGTSDVETLQVKAYFKSSLAETPIFSGRACVDNAVYAPGTANAGEGLGVGLVRRIETLTIPASAAGTIDFNLAPFTRGMAVHRIHIVSSYVSEAELKVDNEVYFHGTKIEADAMLFKFGFTPLSTIFSIVADFTQRITDYIVTANKAVRLKLTTTSGVSDITVVMECIGTITD